MTQVLVDSLWQGAFVFAIAGGLTLVIPGRHASTRYAVWFVALLALPVVPIVAQFAWATPSSTIFISVERTTTAVSTIAERGSGAADVWVACIWSIGVFACATRLVFGYVRVTRLLRSLRPEEQIAERVYASPLVSVPIAAGLRRPVIIIPHDLVRALPATDLDAIIAHERAHLARRDVLGNVIQRVVESLLFFNPWVYLVGRQLVREREAACDDWAVSVGNDADRFASCLANLALRAPRAQASFLTPSALWPKRMLVGRIERLLNGKAIQVKTNYAIVSVAVASFALLGIAVQNPAALGVSPNCSASAQIVDAARPDIPEAVVKAHHNAQVTLAVTVAENGHPSNVVTVKGSGVNAIDEAALRAAQKSTYKPEIRNCRAVAGGTYLFHVDLVP